MDWSTKDFLKEIDDVAQLYALSSCSSMATSMIASLGKKLSTAVSLRAGDYVSLMKHVDGSKLPEEQKLELQKTLSQVASSNGQQSVANKLVKEPQSMTNVPAYLTQADWDVLLQGDLDKAPHVLVARLRLCGITSLKEDSKKVCIALLVQSLLWHGHKMPDPQTIYKMAQQFTFLFNASSLTSQVAPVKKYPNLPTEMGEQWVAEAYGPSEKPVLKDLPQLAELMCYVPVRSTSKLLGANSQAQSSHGSGTDTSSQFVSLLTTLVHQAQAGSTMASPQGRVQIFDFTKKDQQCLAPSTAHALALPQPSHPATQQAAQQTEAASTVAKPGEQLALPAPPLPGQQEPGQELKTENDTAEVTKKSLEDYEAEAMAALQNKKVPNNTKSKAFKRPAAATSKQKAQPTKMEPKAGGAAAAKGCKRQKQDHPSQVQIKAGDLGKYGCKRCRGNPRGCDQCWKESYQGERLPGREYWHAYCDRVQRETGMRPK